MLRNGERQTFITFLVLRHGERQICPLVKLTGKYRCSYVLNSKKWGKPDVLIFLSGRKWGKDRCPYVNIWGNTYVINSKKWGKTDVSYFLSGKKRGKTDVIDVNINIEENTDVLMFLIVRNGERQMFICKMFICT